MRYRVTVHRTVILEEEWRINADTAQEAERNVREGDGTFQEEALLEVLETRIASSRRIPGPDPDIDMDEGL